MNKYDENKAKEIRDTVEEILTKGIKYVISYYADETTITVSDLKFDKDGDVYIHIDLGYTGLTERNDDYYIWFGDIDLWVEPTTIINSIIADIIEDIRGYK